MTPQERRRNAAQAATLYEHHVAPLLEAMSDEYSERINDLAVSELDPAKYAEKVRALSTAIKVVRNLDNGMKAAIADGDVVLREQLRAEMVEKMTPPTRRLYNIAGY